MTVENDTFYLCASYTGNYAKQVLFYGRLSLSICLFVSLSIYQPAQKLKNN